MGTMDLFDQIAALRREGQSFALATVVARRPPVSAHLGDRAIVFADGRMEGFIGGACSREIVRQQALDALTTRQPRIVSIRPDATDAADRTAEHVTVPMTCVSEGAIDVFVEPFLQPRRLVVVGATPVADAVGRLARSMEYEVVRVVDTREQRDLEPEVASLGMSLVTIDALDSLVAEGAARGLEQAAIVASQGHYDEEALGQVLKHRVPYVGLVASRRRAESVRAVLEENGVPGVDAIHNPAGLDLGARTPSEVALSILAEIVQTRPAGVRVTAAVESRTPAAPAPASTSTRAVDPVCGMSVDVAGARQTAEVDGVKYYFCCAKCRSRFLQNPHQFQATR